MRWWTMSGWGMMITNNNEMKAFGFREMPSGLTPAVRDEVSLGGRQTPNEYEQLYGAM